MQLLTRRESAIAFGAFALLALAATAAYSTYRFNAVRAVRMPPVAYPVRITIPSLRIDAPIEQVGLTSDGAVGAPAEPADAAWYTGSPAPGIAGNAVIDGHYGWSKGIAAVFDRLHDIRVGDSISVAGSDGRTHTFVVRSLRTYHANENVDAVFYAADARKHLVLITCEGAWNKVTKSYDGRLVVFADEQS